MLRVSLVGNLGADPEARYTQKGAPITSFRVAVNQVRTAPDGERQENTEWFRVRAVGRLAETAARLTKGGRVLVDGRLELSRYQSRDGEARTGFDVWADEVVNLGGRLAGPGGDESDVPELEVDPAAGASRGNGAGAAAAAPAKPRSRGGTPAGDPEDLPF